MILEESPAVISLWSTPKKTVVPWAQEVHPSSDIRYSAASLVAPTPALYDRYNAAS
jgi:hypothetical protein